MSTMDPDVQIMAECHDSCLEKGGDHTRADHVSLLLDCAEICQTAANFMLRNSELHARTCAVCAEVREVRKTASGSGPKIR